MEITKSYFKYGLRIGQCFLLNLITQRALPESIAIVQFKTSYYFHLHQLKESIMKLIKYAVMAALIAMLVGCGHGYEGEYQLDGVPGSPKVVLGSDYLEVKGQRTTFDKIFVRESEKTDYLVFQRDELEEAWEILDDDTLKGFMNTELVRVK